MTILGAFVSCNGMLDHTRRVRPETPISRLEFGKTALGECVSKVRRRLDADDLERAVGRRVGVLSVMEIDIAEDVQSPRGR